MVGHLEGARLAVVGEQAFAVVEDQRNVNVRISSSTRPAPSSECTRSVLP
jgi:hypothetical protein